jgi:signal peptidase
LATSTPTSTPRRLWKNEYFQTTVTIVVVLVVVFGFWFGSQLILNSQYPALAVASGSMCVPYGQRCDGWTHPFEHTLHVGDLIIVQGVNPADINAAPEPVGDIVVYRPAESDTLIVHRAIEKVVDGNGNISFVIQGDANSGPDNGGRPIPSSRLVGKVVLRIPWVGHLALFMRNSSGLFIIVALIIVLVIVEFVIPSYTKPKPRPVPKESTENTEVAT